MIILSYVWRAVSESGIFLTNRLELTQRTGKIFTARSYHHGNTSESWVEHDLVAAPAISTLFGALLAHFWRAFVTCSRRARHAAHPSVTCSRHLRTFGTLLAHVVEVLVILANLNFFWTNGLELTQRSGKIFTAKSFYHGNTSKSWVEHDLTAGPDFLDSLAHSLAHFWHL